jgi:FSR family fosmidomycin resistance protein-like MFS transporter
VLAAGLAVELADELVDGAKGAALPLIRHDLGLSYPQIGLLASVPLLVGGLLELPLGVLAGEGRRRRLAILAGGIVFVLTLLGAASARSFAVLLCAFIAFFPASGAFVSLTQAELMDTWPDRQAQVMTRWDLAGSTGAVAGPLLLAAVLATGGSWRDTYLALAGLAALAWLGLCLRGPHADDAVEADGAAKVGGVGRADEAGSTDGVGKADEAGSAGGVGRADETGTAGGVSKAGVGVKGGEERTWRVRGQEVLVALRDWETLRWLVLLQVADLLVDVFTGFLALYLVNVGHLRPAVAALAIAIRLGAALAGDAALIVVLERVRDLTVLRVSAVAAALLYPGFLLVPGIAAKLVLLAVLSAATAPWYPLLQARLYGSLPGRSSVAVTLSSAAGLAGGLGPLAVGLAAQAFGLGWALAGLAAVPVAVLAVSATARPGAAEGEEE